MRVGTGAADLRAHGDQEIREIDDFRLARRVLDDGLALGERRRHQQVLGTGHRDGFEHESRAAQPLGARADVAVLDLDVGAHRLQTRRHECSPAAHRSRSRRAATRRRGRSAPAADRARRSTRASCAPARRARRTRGSSTASTSTRILSSIVTLTPMRPSSSIMVVTSLQMRHVADRHRCLPPASVPARIGSAAFLAPEMRTSPSSGTPPRICSLSMSGSGVAGRSCDPTLLEPRLRFARRRQRLHAQRMNLATHAARRASP